MRVLTLLPIVGHARDSKRIDMLLSEGVRVEVAAFNRPSPVNRQPACPVTSLGNIQNGRYLKRIASTIFSLPTAVRLARRNDIIYASGQDMGLIGVVVGLVTGRPVVLEVGDIREIQLDYGLKGRAVRTLERWMTKRLALVVSTAKGFVTGYYQEWLGRSPEYLVIENKLEDDLVKGVEYGAPLNTQISPEKEQITIGYFGLLRYQWSIDALAEAVRHGSGRIKVVLAGSAFDGVDLAPLTDQAQHVEYVGRYRSPHDLRNLYDRVDVIWCCNPISCQDSKGKNWPWARTNRFYESCLFRKPMIVLAGIGDADVVQSLGIGTVLPDTSMNAVRHCIDDLTAASIQGWLQAMEHLPRELYTYIDEGAQLVARMRVIAGLRAAGAPHRVQPSRPRESTSGDPL